jgi:hypothetical protein
MVRTKCAEVEKLPPRGSPEAGVHCLESKKITVERPRG